MNSSQGQPGISYPEETQGTFENVCSCTDSKLSGWGLHKWPSCIRGTAHLGLCIALQPVTWDFGLGKSTKQRAKPSQHPCRAPKCLICWELRETIGPLGTVPSCIPGRPSREDPGTTCHICQWQAQCDQSTSSTPTYPCVFCFQCST